MFAARWAGLFLAQGSCAALGAWLAGAWAGLAGALLGAALWLAWDTMQAHRLWRWLKSMDLGAAPGMGGMWGGLSAQARRWLRGREQSSMAAEQRVHDILGALQASPNGLVLLDGNGAIEWCNQMAERHFGFDATRDLQQSIGNLVRDPAFAQYWQQRDFSKPVLMEGREHRPSHPVSLSVQLHSYGDGRHLLLSRDVTALEQAEATRRDFVANVSHEIRTPLTVLSGFVETLQTLKLEPAEQQHYLGLMALQAARMQNLVQDLLTLSRLEGSPLPDYNDWVPVATLLGQCEVEARGLANMLGKSGGVSAHVLHFPAADAAGMELALAGVQAELMSGFSNLISNALRYTPVGGAIHVGWEVLPDGRAQFWVTDSGPGIDPEHLHRLTERFYRVDRSRSRDTGGTGLGLAIVKHALQRHGAKLEVRSALGQGTTFSAVFPANRLRSLGHVVSAA